MRALPTTPILRATVTDLSLHRLLRSREKTNKTGLQVIIMRAAVESGAGDAGDRLGRSASQVIWATMGNDARAMLFPPSFVVVLRDRDHYPRTTWLSRSMRRV